MKQGGRLLDYACGTGLLSRVGIPLASGHDHPASETIRRLT